RGGWQGLGVPRERLPAGMRNNNPGNIKYVRGLNYPGLVGPSENTDQGDPQMVFESPAYGMKAASSLAMRKYHGGKRTAMDLIAGDMGWTPGNRQAAANIASTMGIDPNEDLRLNDPQRMQSFLRALTLQEHGNASKLYGDDVYAGSINSDGSVVTPTRSAHIASASGAINDANPPASGLGAPEPTATDASDSGGVWSPTLPLLAAGLGMLASDSPYAGVAIGQGGLKGLEFVLNQRKAQSGAQKLADAARLAQQRLGIQTDALTERKRHNEEVEQRMGRNSMRPVEINGRLVQPQEDGTWKAVYESPPKPAGLMAGDRKEIFEADEAIQAANNVKTSLDQAIKLNDEAYSGPAAQTRGYVTSIFGAKGGTATEELQNVVLQ